MKSDIFITIPSLSPTGPIKGAIALANSLANNRTVTLVAIKRGPGPNAYIDDRVKCICLSNLSSSIFGKIREYQKLLINAGGRKKVASISFCFSADLVNLFCSKYAVTCSSIRGNLINIYRMDYGLIGIPAAILHLISLVRFDKVVAMTSAMAGQINFFTHQYPSIVGNFIDEASLNKYRKRENDTVSNKTRFVFVGRISSRKKPMLLIQAIKELHDNGNNVALDMVGTGPLLKKVKAEVYRLKLQDVVTMHGELSNPYSIMSKADIFVLPSLSEGISRASLEALYIGLPCILRRIDGNSELIQSDFNGVLFEKDRELPSAMLKAIELNSLQHGYKNLLPEFFRQEGSSDKYLKLVESI
ncbi:MAG: hypothetical protein CL402_11725 [Acidiferrobacteraceae bacterium]|nr:hypothetical protein [Acidiferrobacteraceae bacterium]